NTTAYLPAAAPAVTVVVAARRRQPQRVSCPATGLAVIQEESVQRRTAAGALPAIAPPPVWTIRQPFQDRMPLAAAAAVARLATGRERRGLRGETSLRRRRLRPRHGTEKQHSKGDPEGHPGQHDALPARSRFGAASRPRLGPGPILFCPSASRARFRGSIRPPHGPFSLQRRQDPQRLPDRAPAPGPCRAGRWR